MRWVPEPTGDEFPTLAGIAGRLSARNPEAARRAAWVYQQLLKLGAGTYIEELSQRYLVIDSDVIFLRDVSFATDDRVRFPYSRAFEYHEPYRQAYERLIGEPPSTDHSLTVHHMLYDQQLLSELIDEIERRWELAWHDAYVDATDPAAVSSISEMDIYGWWVLDRHPELAEVRQLVWRDVHVIPRAVARGIWARDHDFVAAHAYLRTARWRRAGYALAHMYRDLRARLRLRRPS
ncbi:MAG: hypothetical protein E6G56_09610 [Actinobacteria bacterium]|nr:MAG: hypothetical protein E6G56_09610 [Actinomycetota bacterium]